MENESFRETLVIKYVARKIEKHSDDIWSVDDYIKFYEDNKKSLNSLLLDINEHFVDNKDKIERENELTGRQIGCIKRITETFTEMGYNNNKEGAFSHAYYELLDFIFYPEFNLKELAYNEVEIIKMMTAYLLNKADEFIKNEKDKLD